MVEHIDPDFARRVAEYQLKAKKGFAFQAEGTVGGKRARKEGKAWRLRPIYTLSRYVVFLIVLKASLYHLANTFMMLPEQPAVLSEAPFMEKANALLFYPDPISVNFSWFLSLLQTQVGQEVRGFLSIDAGEALGIPPLNPNASGANIDTLREGVDKNLQELDKILNQDIGKK
jgi:hypothetical protein